MLVKVRIKRINTFPDLAMHKVNSNDHIIDRKVYFLFELIIIKPIFNEIKINIPLNGYFFQLHRDDISGMNKKLGFGTFY